MVPGRSAGDGEGADQFPVFLTALENAALLGIQAYPDQIIRLTLVSLVVDEDCPYLLGILLCCVSHPVPAVMD